MLSPCNQASKMRPFCTEVGYADRKDERRSVKKSGTGAIAQLGERLNGIQEVTGSIPVSSTTFFRFLQPAEGWLQVGCSNHHFETDIKLSWGPSRQPG